MKVFTCFLGVFLFLLVEETLSLMCYSGQQRWEPAPEINNISLVRCSRMDRCCFMHSSLDGTYYGCYDDCPSDQIHSCGPDPKSGIQDIRYCYCKNHMDTNCKPYLGALMSALKNDPL
uniref:Uncharacterized protein n=1 Tax=Acrobeloides nanus TaxID=290746 RepID=A0A914DUJ1_9BILA